VPVAIGVVLGWLLGAQATEMPVLVLPILAGGVVGRLIDAAWAFALVVCIAVGGLLILVTSPIDDDIPRWTIQAFVAWMAGVGIVVGMVVRAVADRLERRRSA
jgi:hypothetical protein